jgi:hypothetical protein
MATIVGTAIRGRFFSLLKPTYLGSLHPVSMLPPTLPSGLTSLHVASIADKNLVWSTWTLPACCVVSTGQLGFMIMRVESRSATRLEQDM